MNQIAKVSAEIPAHVPAELVRDFQFWTLPETNADPILAAARAVRETPEIFYALNSRRGVSHTWVVATQELIREVFQTPEVFSSRGGASFSELLGESWDLLPLEVDPPEHDRWRVLLNPVFAPKKMKAVEEDIKVIARQLVDEVLAKGHAEFIADFAEVFPVVIFLSLMGLPLEHATQFRRWADVLGHATDNEDRKASARSIRDYLVDIIAQRRKAPTDDLISYALTTPVGGKPITDEEALSLCFLLFAAGLDTVVATLGFIFKHLAGHPENQQRLRDDPSLIPAAVEEFLRAFPVVVSSRLVIRDVDFHGVEMKAGDRVTVGLMLAGRDPQAFDRPDEVDFDRETINHISFAAGPHRCIGSHLARRELVIALQEWVTRVPPFRVKPGETPLTHAIVAFGVDYLPLVW